MSAAATPKYTRRDFQSDQDVRWCPGCGDYAVLSAVQSVFPLLGIPREKFVFVSGIGCSSRFPYYMNVYGFHTIHGRALPIATGIKLANPELSVWVATGDGDALAIGGNHFIHTLRRNVDVKVLLFNNRIYGLTKGQYSPTSEMGKRTKTTPLGTVEKPVNPVSLALASEATFVARSADVYGKHLQGVLARAARHRGSAFVEVLQNCNVFNDGSWDPITAKEVRDDANLFLEHGQPLKFGQGRDRGLRFRGTNLEVAALGSGVSEPDLAVHDEKDPSGVLPYLLSRLEPPMPTAMGVFRAVEEPTLEDRTWGQIRDARAKLGEGDWNALLASGDTWAVRG